jgi:hypothetical protein
MTDQERREAAVQQVTAALSWAAVSVNGQVLLTNRRIEEVADLICQAREDGRREAAEAIEACARAHRADSPIRPWLHDAAALARGAQPDEKERTDGQ